MLFYLKMTIFITLLSSLKLAPKVTQINVSSFQSFHPKFPPRFPPNLPPRMSPWSPQVKYLKQSPIIYLQNIQSQFPLLILLLVCDFIFLVFIVLSDCYICRIHVILSQNDHIHYPIKFPQACTQGYTNKCFFFPKLSSKVPPKVSPKPPTKDVSLVPPSKIPKAVPYNLPTKHPISVPTSHLVVSL